MNIYETSWYCKCPLNKIRVLYELKIESSDLIYVEKLMEYIETNCKEGFQEVIADEIKSHFGGKQTIKANHHSVTITTIRN
jgi:hypothetical protein